MDLERLANISIDDNPWRSHDQTPQFQPWNSGGMPAGAGAAQGGWGHMSPQQMRNPWQDPNSIAQGVNDALGLGGAPSGQAWGAPMGGGPGDFGETAKIWADPHDQQHYNPMQQHHPGMNGMMDPNGGDWMSQNQPQQLWSDPVKQEQEGYWKHQQQGWGGPPGGMGGSGGWPGNQRMGQQPPPHGQPRGGPMMPGHRGQQGWPPNNGMMGGPGGKPWEPPRGMTPMMRGGPSRGPSRGGGGGGGYPPGPGVDMSVPPPIDMPVSYHEQGMGQQQGMGMRGGPPPGGAGGMWKPDQMGGAPNGMRGGGGGAPNYGGQGQNDWNERDSMQMVMSNQYGMPKPSQPQQQVGQFPIGGADDLMWHDPNGDLKKWQRDTGVSLWGDPEKSNERPVRLWMVAEGEDEDLEVALMKCPVPQKKVDGQNEDGSSRLPFPIPSKRPIVVTGWGELPENDPNNPVKPDDGPSGAKWSEMPPVSNDAPWYLPGQQSQSFANDHTSWGQPSGAGGPSGMMPPGAGQPGPPGPDIAMMQHNNHNTQAIAEQLKYAVEKGYLDMSILTQQSLPPQVLANMNQMLTKIPALESVEAEIKQLVDSIRPPDAIGEVDSNPERFMNDVQKVEYKRLIVEVATVKVEVGELSKKIHRVLVEAGLVDVHPNPDNYQYSFLGVE